MPEELKPYPHYSEFDVIWLRQFPFHWDKLPGLAILSEKQNKNIGLREKTVLSLSYGKIVIKPIEKLHGLVPESFETYQIVEPGDIIIRSTDLQNDKFSLRVGEVKNNGIITSAYLCFNSKNGVTGRYAYLMLHTLDLTKVLYGLGSGLRQNLSWADFKRFQFFIPPTDEQKHITHYLDWKTSQINRFIKAKKRQIELLKEQKQVMINDAVTGKIDVRTGKPYPKYKDSGVDWLGRVPNDWKVRKLKFIAKLKSGEGITSEKIEQIGTYPVFGGNGLRGYTDSFTHEGRYVLIGRQGALCGNINYASGKFWASEHAVVVNPINEVDTIWLGETLRAMNLNQYSIAAAQPGISVERILNLRLPYMDLNEQKRISNFINGETSRIDGLISLLMNEISLVKEFHSRIVSDTVTGKIDLRNVKVPEFDIENEIEGIEDVDGVAETTEEEIVGNE